MAKIYEALKRAEQERQHRTGEPAAVAPVEWAPAAGAGAPRSAGGLQRLWSRLARRRGAHVRSAAAAEINKRRIALLQPDSYVAEQFRSLRVRIDALAAQRPLKTLAVTSPLPGEGKTAAAINLAAVTALSVGRQVLLVDCDLRRPQIHRSLGLRPEAGLAEVLTDAVSLDQAILKVEGANLEVLAVRGRPDNPSELLGSSKMRELIEEVARRYDRVILDTPAALGLPDAKAVCELCDGLVVIVRADVTPQQDIRAALEILDRRRLLGLVLNGTPANHRRYGYVS